MLKSYALLAGALACFAVAQAAAAEEEARAEVRLTIPRSADGTVDQQALLAEVKTAAAGGAREIQLRDRTLTEAEMQNLLSASFLKDLAALLPAGPGEHQIRISGAVDVRVQQLPNGTLRVRIEDRNLTQAQRDALRQ